MTYKYTLLKQDGTTDLIGERLKEMELAEMYKLLDCHLVEVIPDSYYPDGTADTTVIFGDEEGRFKSTNHRNPHMKVLKDTGFEYANGSAPAEWDCVGDLLLVEEIA